MTDLKEERIVASLKKGLGMNFIKELQGVTSKQIHEVAAKHGLNIADKRMKMWKVTNNVNANINPKVNIKLAIDNGRFS